MRRCGLKQKCLGKKTTAMAKNTGCRKGTASMAMTADGRDNNKLLNEAVDALKNQPRRAIPSDARSAAASHATPSPRTTETAVTGNLWRSRSRTGRFREFDSPKSA